MWWSDRGGVTIQSNPLVGWGILGGQGGIQGGKDAFNTFFPPKYSTIIEHLDDDLEQKQAGAELSQAQVKLKIIAEVGVEVAVEVKR